MRRNMPEMQRVSYEVTEIFGEENVAMSFVTGSIVTEHASERSDVDIFVCHKDEPNANRRAKFNDYYFKLHKDLKRDPDELSPGEIMSLEQLNDGLLAVDGMTPVPVIESHADFDSICWAGMLVSKKELLTPRTKELVTYEQFARIVIAKWVKGICGEIEATEATGNETDADKILARKLSSPGYYDAHE